MGRFHAVLRPFVAALLAGSMMACASTAPAEVQVLSVSVSLGSPTLTVGQTGTAVAVVHDQHGNVVEGQSISWSSSNQSIASVGTGAQITALAAGSTQITAAIPTASGSATLTVSPVAVIPVASVGVTLSSTSLTAGQSTQATATTRDANGAVLTGRALTWSSDNTSVATVSSAGLVSSLAAGTAHISATSEGKSGSATLTVTAVPPAPVASVSVMLNSPSLTAGQSTQATATTKDANGAVLTGRAIAWSTNNSAIATVSASGLVTAVAAGSAQITATSEGQSGSATLTVTAVPPAPVATVTVALAASSLTAGQSTQATATTKDANGTVLTGRAIAWSTSNSAIATVSASGLVTAVAAGSAQITASSEGQNGSATLTVTAVPPAPVATVAVSLAASSVTAGQTTQATATTRDANNVVLTGRAIAWSSDNTAVATVSATGLVTSVAAGTAHIIATSEGKSGSATLTVTAVSTSAAECATPRAGWIFCDDFETNRLASYFEYNTPESVPPQCGKRVWRLRRHAATYVTGQAAAGSLALAIGRTPSTYFEPADAGTANYREIYWRFYVPPRGGVGRQRRDEAHARHDLRESRLEPGDDRARMDIQQRRPLPHDRSGERHRRERKCRSPSGTTTSPICSGWAERTARRRRRIRRTWAPGRATSIT